MMPEGRDLSTRYCPGCAPDLDPCSGIYIVSWCWVHAPTTDGAEDGRVAPLRYEETTSPASEPGGERNRLWCDLIHRGRA